MVLLFMYQARQSAIPGGLYVDDTTVFLPGLTSHHARWKSVHVMLMNPSIASLY